MLIRAALVVTVLATAWLLVARGGELPPAQPVAAVAVPAVLDAGVLAGLPEAAVGRRSPPPWEDERLEAAPVEPAPAPAPVGEVRGILMDGDGRALAQRAVLLRRGIGVAEERHCTATDAEGLFHFSGVPAGVWDAGVLVTPRRGQSSATSLHPVEVFAERSTWVDLWATGTREIRGRVLLDGVDAAHELVFEVEVRSALEPSRVIADTLAVADAAEVFEPVPDRAELRRRVLAEQQAEDPGAPAPLPEELEAWVEALEAELSATRVAEGAAFALGGLEPGRYLLRIYLDVSREIYAEFEADLSEFDAEFGLLRL